ncbi:hypothetical protein IT072_09775 [Leifsonia sp. ZF2019]|uniref:hypothetical protein n=1 Tax=Leifsonia sp. ZF2019 TaxID=2781978 RepID=UPI001CBE71DE|nr:hypothetical protein [Leifsonia sp. ZF2019]UAJ81234.1 hypothetical protein IT072_09775 [Leifsonia sp. ZF2019]
MSALKRGHVVLEDYELPAVITRIVPSRGRLTVWARYPWQASREPEWRLGRFNRADVLPKVVERGY